MNEERLRRAYAAAVESGAVAPAGRHATPEAIAALARREGSEAERLATLDHVMSCRECRTDFDLLRSIEQAGAEIGAARTGRRRTWLVPTALAATLLIAVGVGRMLLKPGDDLTRGGEAGALTLFQPGPEAVAGDSLTFSWSPAPGARTYALEVLDAGGSVVLMAEVPDTVARPSVSAGLPPGEYKWWVRATTSDARTVRSAMRPLRLTAR
jgi:hypothetical protein